MKKPTVEIETLLPDNLKYELKQPGAKQKVVDLIRESKEAQVKLLDPETFYKQMNTPNHSRVHEFLQKVEEGKSDLKISENHLSYVMEYSTTEENRQRFRKFNSIEQLKDIVSTAKGSTQKFISLKEQALFKAVNKFKGKEDFFDSTDSTASATSSFPVRVEYSPILGSPFFKQLYLYDYLLMHSKAFWYRNYSGIAKAIVDMTRNFVIGKGFSVSIEDDKANDAWKRYEDRSKIHDKIRLWCDEATTFGELMIKKVMGPQGLDHITVDPSTIWEIVTDPQNITDVKYYHQQYNTQYQIYTDGVVPSSEYVVQQIPPQLMRHYKLNVSSYEKRGRSDLLAPMLYMKYFEDYMTSDLIRKKNESAFIWDVEIDGSDEDVAAYINQTSSIVDVPPGSENVHNKAIKRTPLSPQFSARSPEDTAKTIVAYIAMSTSLPAEYLAFAGSMSKASALVKTEPATKKMEERRLYLENILRDIFKDVMISEGLDPMTRVEFNFPEIIEEDRTSKITDVYTARDMGSFTHRRASEIVAKELNVTNYDFDKEMEKIEEEKKANDMFLDPGPLTQDKNIDDTKGNRNFDRSAARDQNTKL